MDMILNEVVNTLNNIKDIQNPVLLHILTKKGKGMVSLDTENREYHDDAVKFHAVKANSGQNISSQIKKEKTIQNTICSNISKCVWKISL